MRIKKFTSILILFIIGCSNNEKTTECSTFLECLDGTYWTNNNNQSVWTFNNEVKGAYLEVYITGDNCYKYEVDEVKCPINNIGVKEHPINN